ncbi:MAG TPA: response regulator [Acidobacteriota bacterium]|nr:response regulator [Acidobacteriota bacterium]
MALNVLVVDDSAVMRAIVIKTLHLSGVALGQIYEAKDGEQALRVLDENWVDLALIDINMPVLDGMDLIERVRQNPETSDLSIIVVSTESSETRIEKVQRRGVAFVHKPFTPETLRQAILRATGVIDDRSDSKSPVSGSGYDF